MDKPKYLVMNPLHIHLYTCQMNTVSNNNQGIKKNLGAIKMIDEYNKMLKDKHCF